MKLLKALFKLQCKMLVPLAVKYIEKAISAKIPPKVACAAMKLCAAAGHEAGTVKMLCY